LKLLDTFSRILIGIAIFGIALGLYLLFFFKSNDSERNPADRIATINRPQNDTRLKRSGNIHWFPVSQSIDAYNEDVIFTGKDSGASIRFKNGAEVTIHPMSLITISNGNVTLNSGTIEVNLEKGSLKVESFGEQFEVKDKTSFKIENTPKVKRIVSIAKNKEDEEKANASFANIPGLKNYIQAQNITITSPSSGENLPKFPGKSLTVKWKASAVNSNNSFKVEFSPSETFEPISYMAETTFTNAKVPVDVLVSGINYFRVRETSGKAKTESSFFLKDDVRIDYLQPTNLADYQLSQVEAQGVLFEWTNTLASPQKIQISTTSDFSTLLHDETLQVTQKNFNFQNEGAYYWRVGHIFENSVFWAKTASFSLSSKIPISPLEIHSFPKTMDFKLTTHFQVNVHDLNKCADYEFTLSKGNKVVAQITSAKPKLKITKLNDGEYELKVVGRLKSNEKTEPVIRPFTVKNSLPLKAPKIKNRKNVKLFVNLIRKALDFVFPSAHAQVPRQPYYKLEWEGTPGATYEIEISKGKPENVVIREKLDQTFYDFIVPGPETFYWRVRSFLNNEWSPFSETAVMEVGDKITRNRDALMIAPEDGSTVEIKDKKSSIEFTWSEPYKNATYFLEISKKADGSKARVIKVQGGSHKISFKKIPKEIFWRVFAESKFKNRTKNSDYFKITTLKLEKPVEHNLPGKFILRGAAFLAQSANLMDFTDVDLDKHEDSLTGPILEFNGEYLPGRWGHRRSINMYLRYSSLAAGQASISEQKLGAEYGWLSPVESAVKHNIYAGFHFYDNMNFKFGSEINGNYSLMFISGRYLYRRPYSEKVNLELNLGVQLPKLIFNPLIIVRPGINYKLNKKWWMDFFVLFERFSHELQDTENDNNVQIQYQNIALGTGFTYFFGE
jgi:hypothetical protein